MFLATPVALSPGPGYIFTFDFARAPRITVHADGHFLVTDVPPGQYALILWTPHQSYPVIDPSDASRELVVTVTAGQVSDLGELSVNISE